MRLSLGSLLVSNHHFHVLLTVTKLGVEYTNMALFYRLWVGVSSQLQPDLLSIFSIPVSLYSIDVQRKVRCLKTRQKIPKDVITSFGMVCFAKRIYSKSNSNTFQTSEYP